MSGLFHRTVLQRHSGAGGRGQPTPWPTHGPNAQAPNRDGMGRPPARPSQNVAVSRGSSRPLPDDVFVGTASQAEGRGFEARRPLLTHSPQLALKALPQPDSSERLGFNRLRRGCMHLASAATVQSGVFVLPGEVVPGVADAKELRQRDIPRLPPGLQSKVPGSFKDEVFHRLRRGRPAVVIDGQARRYRGRLGARRWSRTFRVRLRLDGDVSIRLRGPRRSNYNLELRYGRSLEARTRRRGSLDRLPFTWCR